MTRMTDLAQLIVAATLEPGDWAVDATVGNGYDTAFLSDRVGSRGHVFGFDVQPEAITAATQRLDALSLANVTLFCAGHETMMAHLPPEAESRIGAVMFNLGYLPGSDKTIITQAQTTLRALADAVSFLRAGGVVTVMMYPAHAGGDVEATTVRSWGVTLPPHFLVTHHRTLAPIRKSPGPELMVITRRKMTAVLP